MCSAWKSNSLSLCLCMVDVMVVLFNTIAATTPKVQRFAKHSKDSCQLAPDVTFNAFWQTFSASESAFACLLGPCLRSCLRNSCDPTKSQLFCEAPASPFQVTSEAIGYGVRPT